MHPVLTVVMLLVAAAIAGTQERAPAARTVTYFIGQGSEEIGSRTGDDELARWAL